VLGQPAQRPAQGRVDELLTGEREQRLADSGAGQRETSAHPGRYVDARVPADLLRVQHVGAVAHGQVNGLVGGLVEVLHEGQRRLAQPDLDRNQLAELEQADTEDVAAFGPLEQAKLAELLAQPVGGALGQVSALGDLV
jgi:hypothetical protein